MYGQYEQKMFQGTCVLTKELMYLLLLQFRQVDHEKNNCQKGKLYQMNFLHTI